MMFKELFIKFKDLLLYLIVGVIATATEWTIFYFFNSIIPTVHYNTATIVAYIISTFVNWLAGRMIVFKTSEQSIIKELTKIYLTSLIGLGLNLVIMYLFVDILCVWEMLSKMIATAVVFFFNFIIRKFLIYKS